jgi:hypothetical protein
MRPRTQIRYMIGSTYRFARDLLSQHSLTWDEWSSPGKLIHPGDLPSTSSITSSEAKTSLEVGYSDGIRVVGQDLAAYLSRRPRCATREAVSRSSRCRRGLLRERHTPRLGYPELVGANDEGRGASR